MKVAENIKPSMPKIDNPKEFMTKLKEHAHSEIVDKSFVGTLITKLTTKKFNWSQLIHDHITSMTNMSAMLKTMGTDVSESVLVQFIINSLHFEFDQFQVNYNTIKEKWNLHEIKVMLI